MCCCVRHNELHHLLPFILKQGTVLVGSVGRAEALEFGRQSVIVLSDNLLPTLGLA